MFAGSDILFNYEFPLHGTNLATQKISNAVARIALGLEKELPLGNIHARLDWGYAPRYVEPKWRILQAKEPDVFVIATNGAHSVEESVTKTFSRVGLDWQEYVRNRPEAPAVFRCRMLVAVSRSQL